MKVRKYSMEMLVGVFVLVGLLCVGYLTIKLGKMELFTAKGYTVTAKFASTEGLRSGANVEVAGVSVGRVTRIELDDAYYSVVTMRIRQGVDLPKDSGVTIKTSGLIGDKFINLSIGVEDSVADGGSLWNTHPPVDLIDLISRYVFGSVQ